VGAAYLRLTYNTRCPFRLSLLFGTLMFGLFTLVLLPLRLSRQETVVALLAPKVRRRIAHGCNCASPREGYRYFEDEGSDR